MKNINKTTTEKAKIKYNIIATFCDISSPKAKRMEAEIVRLKNKKYKYRACFRKNQQRIWASIQELHRLFMTRQCASNNLVPTISRKSIARRLANDTTDTLIVNKGALGNSSTPAANGDIKLGNEVYRNDIASRAFDDNVAYLTFFYTAAETDGTYEEFGGYIDGEAGADSGVLFNHNVEQWVKSSEESMTIRVVATVT